jgi:hypothetical protein
MTPASNWLHTSPVVPTNTDSVLSSAFLAFELNQRVPSSV